MGKNKLAKFADMEGFRHVFQFPFAALKEKGFDMKGKWNEQFFGNQNPIVLELGCGRGEYTVGLARLFPEKNFIGIDIKGSRMWAGAKQSLAEGLNNVAFLRTHIELVDHFFAEGEVSEIWITFPDPQMNKVNKRMTSTRFMRLYRRILCPDGVIHLKSDSNFMFTYTAAMVEANHLPVMYKTEDLYNSDLADDVLKIQTYYEQQWLSRGLTIKYLKFACQDRQSWIEPDIEIEQDPYRSYGRNNTRQLPKE
ncbi:tRNA (guanine-N7-)-methyltransferase [Dysgonomonas sp. PH5-45]|uniref:tRNA (guanosine(46)-N7)-methyltransferase TrmB n=1 Tax=unclassified Dysgonomonas TaxID=2630389 RepID=UPI0024748531|nr:MULTISPECIES: tRNA (guanosine(46)-N7)-methyltransferase TrmB [unclassified Dysgonomonas]MDH6355508.1 tRNA (guanine-N7-)-methyltransferase [Dysgonomonas sp. PH5-45]